MRSYRFVAELTFKACKLTYYWLRLCERKLHMNFVRKSLRAGNHDCNRLAVEQEIFKGFWKLKKRPDFQSAKQAYHFSVSQKY